MFKFIMRTMSDFLEIIRCNTVFTSATSCKTLRFDLNTTRGLTRLLIKHSQRLQLMVTISLMLTPLSKCGLNFWRKNVSSGTWNERARRICKRSWTQTLNALLLNVWIYPPPPPSHAVLTCPLLSSGDRDRSGLHVLSRSVGIGGNIKVKKRGAEETPGKSGVRVQVLLSRRALCVCVCVCAC